VHQCIGRGQDEKRKHAFEPRRGCNVSRDYHPRVKPQVKERRVGELLKQREGLHVW